MNQNYDALLKRLAAVTPAASRVTRGDLFDLVRAIEVLAVERPNPDQLWSVHRVGSYLGIDALTAERLLAAPGAPQPMTGHLIELWRAKDIYLWLDGHGARNVKAVKG